MSHKERICSHEEEEEAEEEDGRGRKEGQKDLARHLILAST